MADPETTSSPRWTNTTKLVVGLTLMALVIALIFRFRNIIAPLLVAFILAYLLYPLATFFNKKLKVPWRLISILLYLLIFLIILGLLTWSGFSIVEQIQNLINYIQGLVTDLPGLFTTISSKPLIFGPFTFDLSQLDLQNLWSTLQGVVEPMLTKLGGLIGSLASGIGSTITWLLFIVLISYFIMSESDGARSSLIKLRIPNHREDISKMGSHLSHIWNAFLRGQLFLFVVTVAFYSLLLSVLGVRYFFLLAFLAGLARFVPYVGPWVTWTTYFLVALFQVNHLGLTPIGYTLLVVGLAMITDVIMDNFVTPRVMSDALEIHPAAVLVMVIVSASLFGLLGVLLAAPTLASLKLLFTYVFKKLMDEDPWQDLKKVPPQVPISSVLRNLAQNIAKRWRQIVRFFNKIFRKRKTDDL